MIDHLLDQRVDANVVVDGNTSPFEPPKHNYLQLQHCLEKPFHPTGNSLQISSQIILQF